MRTIETKIYAFGELSESAQDRAVDKLYDLNVDTEWWDSTYDDAGRIGLKITSFDGRGGITGKFTDSAEGCAHSIQDEHGPDCETLKTADSYLAERDRIIEEYPKDEHGDFEDVYLLDNKLDDLDGEFLHDILEDYRIILDREYEYLTSREAIVESIEANEYEFTENGDLA